MKYLGVLCVFISLSAVASNCADVEEGSCGPICGTISTDDDGDLVMEDSKLVMRKASLSDVSSSIYAGSEGEANVCVTGEYSRDRETIYVDYAMPAAYTYQYINRTWLK